MQSPQVAEADATLRPEPGQRQCNGEEEDTKAISEVGSTEDPFLRWTPLVSFLGDTATLLADGRPGCWAHWVHRRKYINGGILTSHLTF